MSPSGTPARTSVLWLIAVFALLWFGTLEHRRLINPDEGRYAEIPREMVASGDWTTPRLNDIKYFYKPPLQYWATAAAFTLFGEHHWTARLWPALTGFLGVLFTGFATARLFSPLAGLIAGAVLGSSVLWNVIGHANTLDMGVSALLAAAVLALCLAQRDDSVASRRWLDGAWALLALATLSKGLIGLVLPAATVVAYMLWQRDWGLLARLRLLRGIAILLAITAPWFIAVSIANPEFPHYFFIHEHFERFLTKTHGRYQPAWYFIPILLVGMIPWLGSLLQSFRPAGVCNGFVLRAALPAGMDGRGFRLFLRIEFQTRLLHPADLSLDCRLDRGLPGAATASFQRSPGRPCRPSCWAAPHGCWPTRPPSSPPLK
jgi:4-amino-4-deoxy-L-arabinose transferase-like glycosyltransferase